MVLGFAFFKVTSVSTAGSRTGVLSLINIIPLFFGFHLGYLADLLGVSLRTYRWVHIAAASMAIALGAAHVVIHAVMRHPL